MTRIVIFIFVLLSITIENKAQNQTIESIDLKNVLEKYNGFYTGIESTEGKIPGDKIPESIRKIKALDISNTSIQLLRKINNGYLFTYNVEFGNYKVLVISTLDNSYVMKDFKFYTDGTGAEKVENDTIAMTSFGNDYVNVEIMHPNLYEEPLFSVDGIRKVKLKITNDLELAEEVNP